MNFPMCDNKGKIIIIILTLQKATKVVEGKKYILPNFSLKATLTQKFFFGWSSQ
jgi:hypothetical protein